jgi:hypothetical protein
MFCSSCHKYNTQGGISIAFPAFCTLTAAFLIGEDNKDRLAELYHPCLNDSANKERSISVADYMFIRSFSPFPTNTGAELHGECTTVECRPLRMSPCFQAIDRFCSTFALLTISMKRHKSRRYGGSWCAEDGFSFEQKKLILLKTERGTLKAIIG